MLLSGQPQPRLSDIEGRTIDGNTGTRLMLGMANVGNVGNEKLGSSTSTSIEKLGNAGIDGNFGMGIVGTKLITGMANTGGIGIEKLGSSTSISTEKLGKEIVGSTIDGKLGGMLIPGMLRMGGTGRQVLIEISPEH